jgi:hypothetical protein
LHNDKLHNLYSSPHIIRMIKSGKIGWARTERKCIKCFLVKPETKESLGKRKRIWEHNIKMGLKEIGLRVVEWIHLFHGQAGSCILFNDRGSE